MLSGRGFYVEFPHNVQDDEREDYYRTHALPLLDRRWDSLDEKGGAFAGFKPPRKVAPSGKGLMDVPIEVTQQCIVTPYLNSEEVQRLRSTSSSLSRAFPSRREMLLRIYESHPFRIETRFGKEKKGMRAFTRTVNRAFKELGGVYRCYLIRSYYKKIDDSLSQPSIYSGYKRSGSKRDIAEEFEERSRSGWPDGDGDILTEEEDEGEDEEDEESRDEEEDEEDVDYEYRARLGVCCKGMGYAFDLLVTFSLDSLICGAIFHTEKDIHSAPTKRFWDGYPLIREVLITFLQLSVRRDEISINDTSATIAYALTRYKGYESIIESSAKNVEISCRGRFG